MSAKDRFGWDRKYAACAAPQDQCNDDWCHDLDCHLEPTRALELACGLGHNAIWLAKRGWIVDAVDISAHGIQRAVALADREQVSVNWIVADLDEWVPEENAYDLVVVFRFLDRQRVPRLIERALRPAGLLIYETFTVAHLARPDCHMKNPAFALSRDELPRLFPALDLVEYAEVELADRSVARMVARKRGATNRIQH